ncbi:MAG: PAS domain-containing protein [Betaproteobacteria bacterium]|nr:PAS domain-containing protein [Betaproteobacteria bacterium]
MADDVTSRVTSMAACREQDVAVPRHPMARVRRTDRETQERAMPEQTLRGRAARMHASTTDVEHLVDPLRPIVSRTDVKGKITYVNPAFLEISGFAEDELIGKPHNVVRHPDMPPEAFEDLWATLRSGHPWRGLVKNRCKNGDYYWVDAYVSPLTENGETVGYMSVRTAPSVDRKRTAERLYAAIRDGRERLPRTQLQFGRSLRGMLGGVFASAAALGVAAGVLPAPWSIVAGAVLVVGSAVAYAWLWHLIRSSTVRIREDIRHIAEGDLAHDAEPDGPREFADILVAVRTMKVNLRAVIADVAVSGNEVHVGTRALADRAQGLMSRSQQQYDGISSVASALEQLSVSVNEIAEATGRSSDHADEAIRVVGEGSTRMDESLAATRDVVDVVDAARTQVEALSEAVGNISSVTQTIQEIAEQTNLLALNAAIEAARAGEQGRGFAVVADEVRKLAERTRASTMDISRTVADVQAGTAGATETMRTAADKVNRGANLIHASNESLHAIREASQGIAASAREIATMLDQQSRASSEVAASMERMSGLTEENVAAIGDVNDASSVLAGTADALHKLLHHFRGER